MSAARSPAVDTHFMEFAGQLRASEACNYLSVPGLSPLDPDEDEGDLIVGFRPRSSPIPSRRCSTSDEDSDPEPPFCGSRRVSFADAKGLSLVQVKEFNTSDVPKLPGYDFVDGEGKDSVEYHLSPLTFSLPLSPKEVFAKVLNQKVELETVELLPGTTILKGVIRVLNISYDKSVYIRTSLDRWATHFDLLAEYVSGSSDGVIDSFSFKLTLVPPFGDQGVRVDFCLRYETPVGTFWSNNNNANYVLSCQRRMKEGIEKLQRENANKKSCLKAVSQSASTVENISSKKASSQEKMSTDESVGAPEVGTLNIPEGQSATSNAEEQTLLMENKQNSSRRRKRQAARMARLRSYYAAQREGGEDDAGKDNKPKETPKQETLEEIPGDNFVSLQPLNEGKNKPENDQFVYEDLGVSSIPQYNDDASNQQVKSDSAVIARAESASGISTKSLPSAGESAAAEPQHFIECFTTNQDGDGSLGRTNGSGTASSEILISKTDRVTFGMVVAPLYSQAFEKVSAAKTVSSGNFTLPSETREICGVLPVNTGSSMGEVQGNVTDSQGSNDLVIKLISPTFEDQEAVNKILKHTENVENPTEMEKQPDQNAIYSSLNLQSGFEDKVPPWSLYSQTEADEEILANKATKPGKYKSPEQSPPVVSVNEDETPAEDEPKVGLKPQIILEHNDEGGVQLKNYESTEVKNKSYKTCKSSIEDNLLQNLDELNCNQTDGRGFMESVEDLCEPEKMLLKSQNTCLEIQEKKNMENKNISGSENDESNSDDMHVMYEAAQSILNEVRSSNHYHAGTSGRLHDQDVQEKKCEMEPSFSNQDENFLIDEGKNWETMVEEEVSVLSNEEEGEQIDSKTEASRSDGKEIKEGSAVALERKVKQGYVIMADRVESTEEDKMDGQEAAELQDEAEFDSVGTEKVNVEDKEEKMEIEMKEDILTQWNKENGGQKISDFKQIIVVTADSEIAKQDREDKVWAFKLKSDFTGNKDEDGASALVSRAANKDISEGKYGCVQMDTSPSHEAGLQDLTDQSNGMFHSSHRGTCDPVEEADSASAESDSDEELQLYVHCLRAAGASPQAHKAKVRGAGFTAHKKTSVGKVKVPPTLMPSISEALDEEQQQRFLPETHKDIKIAAEATSNPQERMNQNQWRWKEVFSCSNVSKSLLCASLMVVFGVVAYHYDFLACFLLYLISVIWLCCQGEKPPIKNKQKD